MYNKKVTIKLEILKVIKSGIATRHTVNIIIQMINHSCFSFTPVVFKKAIAILLAALFIILFLIAICFIIGIPYYFIKEYIKNKGQKPAISVFKDVWNLMIYKLKNPNKNNFSSGTINASFPFIAVLMLILLGLKIALPFIFFTCLANNKIQDILHFKLNYWIDVYLLTIVFVYYSLIF